MHDLCFSTLHVVLIPVFISFQLKVGYSFMFYRTCLWTLVEGIVLSQCLHPREFYADNNVEQHRE